MAKSKTPLKSASKAGPRKTAVKRAGTKPKPRKAASLEATVVAALEDMKATNIKVIDVSKLTVITDTMIVASGTSDRHVRSIADSVIKQATATGVRPLGAEGERDGEWVLVDLPGVLVHIMLPRVREFYGLEKLWEV